jgi:hypothetical protein
MSTFFVPIFKSNSVDPTIPVFFVFFFISHLRKTFSKINPAILLLNDLLRIFDFCVQSQLWTVFTNNMYIVQTGG